MKTHIWKKGRESIKNKKPRRKFHFKQIARLVTTNFLWITKSSCKDLGSQVFFWELSCMTSIMLLSDAVYTKLFKQEHGKHSRPASTSRTLLAFLRTSFPHFYYISKYLNLLWKFSISPHTSPQAVLQRNDIEIYWVLNRTKCSFHICYVQQASSMFNFSTSCLLLLFMIFFTP